MSTDLAQRSDGELYEMLEAAAALRAREAGRRNSPEAAQVRAWCKSRQRAIRAELTRRGLPTNQPGVWTGIGRGFVSEEVGR